MGKNKELHEDIRNEMEKDDEENDEQEYCYRNCGN